MFVDLSKNAFSEQAGVQFGRMLGKEKHTVLLLPVHREWRTPRVMYTASNVHSE